MTKMKQESNSYSADGERFTTRKEALDWLKANHYKISQGKFYQDCSAGFPMVHKDGSVSRYQVLMYAQQIDLSTKAEDLTTRDEARRQEQRKIKAEAEIAEMKAEKMRREEDRYWLHAEEAWAQLAALVATLRDTIRHHLFTSQRELVHIVSGDQDRSNELAEYADGLIDKAFNEVAGAEIDVVFEKET
jgi:hypothetical protein